MCFIVAGLKLLGMAIALSLLVSVAIMSLLAELIRRGFRDGDLPSDPAVVVYALPTSSDAHGNWVEVTIENPSPAVALVGLRLRALRRPRWWPSPAAARRGGRERHPTPTAEHSIGAVPAGHTASFWLWIDDPERVALEAAIGLPNRLRRHRLSVPAAPREASAPSASPAPVPSPSPQPSAPHARLRSQAQ